MRAPAVLTLLEADRSQQRPSKIKGNLLRNSCFVSSLQLVFEVRLLKPKESTVWKQPVSVPA